MAAEDEGGMALALAVPLKLGENRPPPFLTVATNAIGTADSAEAEPDEPDEAAGLALGARGIEGGAAFGAGLESGGLNNNPAPLPDPKPSTAPPLLIDGFFGEGEGMSSSLTR